MSVYPTICWCAKISHVSVNHLIRIVLHNRETLWAFWDLTQERLRDSTDYVAPGRRRSWRKRGRHLRGGMASMWQRRPRVSLQELASALSVKLGNWRGELRCGLSAPNLQTFKTSTDPGKYILIHFSPRYFPMLHHCFSLWYGISQMQTLMPWLSAWVALVSS